MTDKRDGSETGAARGRDADLREAMLRIGASLDLDAVLREVVESARALTGAAYGCIVTVDAAGAPRDFVTSGYAPEEHRAMEDWADRMALFGRLRETAAPLRLPDLDAWVRSLGLSPVPVPCGAFQATAMRHRGAAVGGFFVGGKDGGFADADGEVLALFAQQAAAAVDNARAHREECRTRAELEALVETCPVGVVVFDASGAPLSVNREARRVVALEGAEGSTEELREALVCRRGDGREQTLADLVGAETVRAEEVEISVRGGGSVRALIDATPIRGADGAVERVVVALRDLAPFEALERSRAGTPSRSTCRRTCRRCWPTGGASRRCWRTCSPTPRGTPRRATRSGWRRRSWARKSRCRSPTAARACRRSGCRTCSGATTARGRAAAPASGW